MKKKPLYGILAAIIIIIATISSIYLYKKYTVRFSTISLEDLEFESESPDLFHSKSEFEHTPADAPK